MMLRRALRVSNRRIRVLVGLLLAGLFCIQCTRTAAFKESKFITVIKGKPMGKTSPQAIDQLERLAKMDHAALLKFCMTHYKSHFRDYTCTLVKQERLRGKLGDQQWTDVKFRDKPFSVAMAWTHNAGQGDRVLYAQDKYGGKMLVRPTSKIFRGLLGTVQKDPEGKEARGGSLRTVNQFGFYCSMGSLLDYYHKGRQAGVLKEEFGRYAQVAGRNCIVLIRYLPDTSEWPSHKTLTYIDVDYLVPICVEGFDSAGGLICRYVYKDVKFNVGLTDADFTPEANGMDPPK